MAIYLGSNKVTLQEYITDEQESSGAVRFIDYDGTILHEYSKDEFLALSSMPVFPTHTGLVSQGWNWSLSDAQEYVEEFGYLDIGQMYITQSGDTEIDVYFHPDCIRLSPILYLCVDGSINIDWGDNSTQSTVTASSLVNRISNQHTYAQPGNYTIKIHVNSGSFAFYNYNAELFNSQVIVKNIRLGENCLIKQDAFRNCYSLQSITIPSTVTSLGSGAIQQCYSLNSVTIPNTVTLIGGSAFYNCYSLQSITIPNTVTLIGGSAFYNCYSLQSITIPSTVTSIGDDAFSGCRFIKKFGPKVSSINNTIRIDNVENLPGYAFHNCYSLQSVTISDGVTSIGPYSFYNCYSLQSIEIPDTVTSIDTYAFYGCSSLQSIEIPDTVTSIDTYAFYNCYSLQSVTIPSELISISAYAFYGCYSLSSITIQNGVTSIDTYAFYGCSSLSSITIPSTITSIGDDAFSNCYSLNSITIPSGVTSISNYAFAHCCSLQSITIPNTVTSIGTYAFTNCYSLQSITIPNTVTSIGNYSFRYCSCMKEYHLESTTPPTLGSNVFTSIPSDCIIYVPQGSLSAYQSATNWSAYANYMQEETN